MKPPLQPLSCAASWSDTELVIANRCMERRWKIRGGRLYPSSVKDLATGREWLARTSAQPSLCPSSAFGFAAEEPLSLQIESHTDAHAVSADSLHVTATASGSAGVLKMHFRVYPDSPAITSYLTLEPREGFAAPPSQDEALATDELPPKFFPAADLADAFDLAAPHLRIRQVILNTQSDVYGELVQEQEWLLHPNECMRALQGNLFVVEDVLSGDSLIFLKEAPPPRERRPCPFGDFRFNGYAAILWEGSHSKFGPAHPRYPLVYPFGAYGHGMEPGCTEGYRWTLLCGAGGRPGVTKALHDYQQRVRPYHPRRDGLNVSNTWGDGHGDSRLSTAFIEKEIAAAQALGLDVVQVDGGWEEAFSLKPADPPGPMAEGTVSRNPKFWQPHPQKFPEGMAGLVRTAKGAGLDLGLWFIPDAKDEYASWERDAATVLEFYRDWGARFIKFDGIRVHSRKGERNVERMFERVLAESQGEIVCDLDITAETRPGHFGAINVGPMYIENRYTDYHRYWPHQTLRTLWKMARYIQPQRLRMEFLNNARSLDRFVGDPLAPGQYKADAVFASVMFSSPLAFFDVSDLPPEFTESAGPLIRLWKQHRESVFRGNIYPIGAEPDGVAWTGFVAHNEAEKAIYLLAFRELNDQPTAALALPPWVQTTAPLERLAGEGSADLAGGTARVTVPERLRFFFGRCGEG